MLGSLSSFSHLNRQVIDIHLECLVSRSQLVNLLLDRLHFGKHNWTGPDNFSTARALDGDETYPSSLLDEPVFL